MIDPSDFIDPDEGRASGYRASTTGDVTPAPKKPASSSTQKRTAPRCTMLSCDLRAWLKFNGHTVSTRDPARNAIPR